MCLDGRIIFFVFCLIAALNVAGGLVIFVVIKLCVRLFGERH